MKTFIAYRPAGQEIQYFESVDQSDTYFHLADFEKQFQEEIPVQKVSSFSQALHFKVEETKCATKQDYIEVLKKAVALMQENKGIDKIVCSRSLEHPISVPDWEQLYLDFCAAYPQAHVILLSHPNWGTWLGASPELILAQQEGQWHTMALAGTKWDENTPWGRKEKEEQAFVSDFIRRELDKLEVSWVLDGRNTHTVQAGALYHLRSDFSFESNRKAQDFLKVLHPTPAVAGTPTQAAMDFIAEHEGRKRSLYAGYWGIQTKENASFFVNLRCMRLHSDRAEIFVGGGVTKDSDPAKEWEETAQKSQTILKILKQYENIK